jgi:hypothetical protein
VSNPGWRCLDLDLVKRTASEARIGDKRRTGILLFPKSATGETNFGRSLFFGLYYFAFNLTLTIQSKPVRDWIWAGEDSSWQRRCSKAFSTASIES